MASNKNQHYVPRCYLKAFSTDGAGAAIGLFNIDRELFVPAAPLKHQCSRDYFYGEDLRLEKALQEVEGHYAELAREIVTPGYALTADHRGFLRKFWLIQHLRTEAASRRMVQMSEQMTRTAGITDDKFKMGIKDAVQHSMSVAFEQLPFVQDMKVCLLRNRTSEPFIVSDDPAVLTNRWHLESPIPSGKSFGLGAAGSIFLLPLTPQIQCVAYDGDVYSVPHERGWAEVRRSADVQSINQHQFLNSNGNVYVHEKHHEQSMRLQFAKAKQLRPAAKHLAHYAVFDSTHDGASRYRVVERDLSAVEHEDAIIHMETVHPRPSSWPSQIGRRNSGSVFTNGTRMGYVRRMQVGEFGAARFWRLRPW